MNRRCTFIIIVAALTALFGIAATPVSALGDPFELSWWTIDSGGGSSIADDLQLDGAIGQPDAGVQMIGGDFELVGGFWHAGGPVAPPCPADITGDDVVDVFDLLALLEEWGPCEGCAADLNADGVVDVFDLLALLDAWGGCS